MARRILVTGARGFVGRHLLDLLRAESPEATIYAWRRPHRAGGGASSPVASAAVRATDTAPVGWSDVDILDRAAVRAALATIRPGEVYHLAGAAHVGRSWVDAAATLELNVVGTHLLLDELRRLGLDARVVVPGSAMIYAPSHEALTEESPVAPASPYALSKLGQELLGRRAHGDDGQQVLLVRAFNHVGPGQAPSFFASGFARQLARIEAGLAPPVLRVGNLEARRDLTDVRDTVRAYQTLMQRGAPGRPYNVCSGRAWAIGEVLEILLARCRVSVYVDIDPTLLRPNDVPLVLGSFARVRAETGWEPRLSLERTLSDVLDEARHDATTEAQGGPYEQRALGT